MEKEKRIEEKRNSLFPYLRGRVAAAAVATALSMGMANAAIAESPNNHDTTHSATSVVKKTNWMLQSGITMTAPRKSLPWMVRAVERKQENGYGYMAVGNGVTNNSYICQVGLGYNWPMQDGTYREGFRLVVTAFRPGGSLYTLASGENNETIKEFDATIKEGQYIQLDMSVSNDTITITALNTFEKKAIKLLLPVKGAKEFIGSDTPFSKIGMETGLMVEEHLAGSKDSLTSSGSPVEMLKQPTEGKPPKYDEAYLWGFESNVKTGQLLFKIASHSPVMKGSINYFNLRTSYDSSEGALVFGSDNK